MAHTIVTNICEGVADCVDACPVACIHDGPGILKELIGTGLISLPVLTVVFACKSVQLRVQSSQRSGLKYRRLLLNTKYLVIQDFELATWQQSPSMDSFRVARESTY